MTWSARPQRRDEGWPRPRSNRASRSIVLLLAAALLGTGLAQPPGVRAADCEIPARPASALPPAASPVSTGDTSGSSVILIEGEETAATPRALPAATPLPPAPDPIASLTSELTAVAESLAACLSSGDAEMVTALAGERYLGQIFGSSVPLSAADYQAIVAELRPVPARILAIEEVARPADDRATAIVTQVVGNQLMRAEWTFEPAARGERAAGESTWKLAFERSLPVEAPRGANSIDVEIRGLAFALSADTVAGPDVVLRGDNVDAEDHELLVLKFADGFTTDDLLRAAGPDLPAEVTFIGETPVRAGQEQDLVLVDLEPGEYTIVCLFPDADGLPHLALGMEATFTVE